MAENRNIDIKLRQKVDEESVSTTQKKLTKNTRKTEQELTAITEQESRKRIAQAEQEAEARRRAAESVPAAEASTSTVRPRRRRSGGSSYLRELAQTEQKMTRGVEQMQEWDIQLLNLTRSLETISQATGLGSKLTADLGMQFNATTAAGTELTNRMRNQQATANELAEALRNGTVAGKRAAIAMEKMRERNRLIADDLKQHEALVTRQAQRGEALMGWQEQKAAARGITDIEEAADAAAAKVAMVGQAGMSAGERLKRGFTMANKAVQGLRNVVTRVSMALALVDLAWNGLQRVWGWLQHSNEEASEATKAHTQEVERLKEEQDELFFKGIAAGRRLKAERVFETMAENAARVNRELTRGVELHQRTIDTMKKERQQGLDRQQWALEEEEEQVKRDEERGLITEKEAVRRRADIKRRRESLEFERGEEDRRAAKEGLLYEQGKLKVGMSETQADVARLEELTEKNFEWYTADEIKNMQARRLNGMKGEERGRFAAHLSKARQLLERLNLGDLFDAYRHGDIDLKAEVAKRLKQARTQLETLQDKWRDNADTLEALNFDQTHAQEELAHKLGMVRLGEEDDTAQAENQATRGTAATRSRAQSQRAKEAREKAQERKRKIDQRNKMLIENRVRGSGMAGDAGRPEEAGVEELYSKMSESADSEMLKLVLQELRQGGMQVRWKKSHVAKYNQANIRSMAGLRGEARKWWKQRFESLGKSMALESRSEALGQAAETMQRAEQDMADKVGKAGEGLSRLGEVFERSLQHTGQLADKLDELVTRSERAERQSRHQKRL